MPLVVQPATEADAPRAADIERAAYAPNPFNPVLFPGPFPAPTAGESPRAMEMAKNLKTDPSIRWFKVVDTAIEPGEDNKQMIGFAQWHINDGSQVPAGPRTFGPGCNAEACEALFGGLDKMRAKHYGNLHHVQLRLLHVDPEHQRRGAGRMLVMWGVEEAKRLGMPAFLESSVEGHSLYLSCGFYDIDVQSIDCTKWGKPANAINYIMALRL
ncbi:putative gnat family protein [Rosellinia necatrix]|uniref:Putative gnat family protein n=1 Tax=Rosellinia necatrix TaxID=77044 RepID=A0A1S7UK13_ROSNE|nr:putative gnat family protein [Rosellinia necatrix]